MNILKLCIIAILFAVTVFFVLIVKLLFGWDVLTEINTGEFKVVAKLMKGNATTPIVTGIFLEKHNSFLDKEKEMVRLNGIGRDINLLCSNKQIILASVFDSEDDFEKDYVLFNILNLPDRKITLSSSDEVSYSEIIEMDSTKAYKAGVRKSLKIRGLFCVRIHYFWGSLDGFTWDFYILNADIVKLSFFGQRDLNLLITWEGNANSEDVCIGLPEEASGFIVLPCGGGQGMHFDPLDQKHMQ